MGMRTRLGTPTCDPPDLLTVEEMALVMRIGRSSAYTLLRHYLATNGDAGLSVIRVGNLLRVPRALLEQVVGGPITWPPADLDRMVEAPQPTHPPTPAVQARPARSLPEQPALPFRAEPA